MRGEEGFKVSHGGSFLSTWLLDRGGRRVKVTYRLIEGSTPSILLLDRFVVRDY